ncbi:hypothetical protein GX50_02833 [[Emmonsia] crescens]|uniref:Uncharacterized protein n=1 Tax=[Emmonsia] crescens TaxID=73230 RepID=A0A2B7ZM12_9EURO|nr:hypothetical protein GX50_02833 [Emmonsia crescens]
MNAFNSAGSLPMHTATFQISIVDIFFPGFTSISASIQQLLVTDLNSCAHILCFCSMLLFLVHGSPCSDSKRRLHDASGLNVAILPSCGTALTIAWLDFFLTCMEFLTILDTTLTTRVHFTSKCTDMTGRSSVEMSCTGQITMTLEAMRFCEWAYPMNSPRNVITGTHPAQSMSCITLHMIYQLPSRA